MRTGIPGPGPSFLGRKLKERRKRYFELAARGVEGDGGTDGMVLPLDMVGSGVWDVAYTIPIEVGTSGQNMSLQVDTGSSDLWIASTSCTDEACSETKGRLYDPTLSSKTTGIIFNISYLQGNVVGPIVWDQVQLGAYGINFQALAAATTVNSESLSYDYDGILGLAPPLNSVISQLIPPVTSNNPDGASFSSNLFGITPRSQAPAAHYFSLVLQRPGSDRLPSLLGIGRHPSEIVSDPSQIQYSIVVSDAAGTLFWKTYIKAITVYVNNQPMPVTIPRGVKDTPFPVAVLDSGVPLIVTTSEIANGIYGALGIGPAPDGQYYVPCTTPLNMTITLDNRTEISLHPLDLTSQSPDDANSDSCVGVIQAADSTLDNPSSNIGDMILGVPFLRNTYTVMAYGVPYANGNFSDNTDPDDASQIRPRLGLMGLTNATIALEEFHTVRVLNQPLSPSNGQTANDTSAGSKKMSVGIEVLIGLVGFFGVCVVLFALRWFLTKRKWNRAAAAATTNTAEMGETKDAMGFSGYQLTRRKSRSSLDHPSDLTLRTTRSVESKKKDRIESEYTVSSGRTQYDGDFDGEFGLHSRTKDESHDFNDPWDPRNYSMAFRDSLYEPDKVPASPETPELAQERQDHQRTTSELRNQPQAMLVPLLAHTRGDSRTDDLGEFGLIKLSSMAGVGTAARGSKIDTGLRKSSISSLASSATSARPSSPVRRSSSSPRGPRPPSSKSISNSLSSNVEEIGHEP